jgi:hypothetical protein
MHQLAVITGVIGDQDYYNCASLSIPSFLRNCPNYPLIVFTDKPDIIKQYKITNMLYVINIEHMMKKYVRQNENIYKRHPKEVLHIQYKGRQRIQNLFWASIIYVWGEYIVRELLPNYTHILRIDCDSIFIGGNVLINIFNDLGNHDMCMVERSHPAMLIIAKEKPGSGFTLWRIASEFMNEYVGRFNLNDQHTVHQVFDLFCQQDNAILLSNPSYHFMYPFVKNLNFSRDQARNLLPACFHLGGNNAYENMKKLVGVVQ